MTLPTSFWIRARSLFAPALPQRPPAAGVWVTALIAVLVCAYTFWFRVDGISRTFMFLGDQVRDWTFALGPAQDLPLTGAPSLAGGRSLGPIYYWLLWLIRVTIGPFCDNLPHAGGIGLSLLQSVADTALLLVLRRRFNSLPLAAATVLLIATSPFDAAVSASIWNTQVGVAFAKLAMAVALVEANLESRASQLLLIALAWMSVQSHITALFVAAGVLLWGVTRQALSRRWAASAWAAYDTVALVAVLQVPFFLQHMLYGPERGGGPTRAVGALRQLLAPGLWDNLLASAAALARYAIGCLFEPWHLSWMWIVVATAAVVTIVRTRSHGAVWLFVTVLPLGAAIIVWTPFRDRLDYWYLALAPSVAVMMGLAISTWRWTPRWRQGVGLALLAAILLTQPSRFTYSRKIGRLDTYGSLVTGARQIVASGVVPRAVDMEVPDPGTDPGLLVTILGGRLDAHSPVRATILSSGRVVYTRLRE
jgi:hypothetical protein